MIDNSDAYGLWLTSPHLVRARKAHLCQNCRAVIQKGETYTSGSWLDKEWSDSIVPVKTCQKCVTAASWLDAVCNGHLWGGDAIAEDLQEHWDEEWDFRCRSFALLLAQMHRGWKTRDGDPIPIQKVESLTKAATKHALQVISAA